MYYTIEEITKKLREEFQDAPYSTEDMLGNAACNRKIRQFIATYRNENRSKSECQEALWKIFDEFEVSRANKIRVSELLIGFNH